MKSKFVVATFDRTPDTQEDVVDNANKVRDIYNEGYRHVQSFAMGQLDYGVFEFKGSLADLARNGGLDAIRNNENAQAVAEVEQPAPPTEPSCAFDGTHVSHEAVANPVNEVMISDQVLKIVEAVYGTAWGHRSTTFSPDTFLGQKLRDTVNGVWACFTYAEWSKISTLEEVIQKVISYCNDLRQKPLRETADTTAATDQVHANPDGISDQVRLIFENVYGLFPDKRSGFVPTFDRGRAVLQSVNIKWSNCFTADQWASMRTVGAVCEGVLRYCATGSSLR